MFREDRRKQMENLQIEALFLQLKVTTPANPANQQCKIQTREVWTQNTGVQWKKPLHYKFNYKCNTQSNLYYINKQ